MPALPPKGGATASGAAKAGGVAEVQEAEQQHGLARVQAALLGLLEAACASRVSLEEVAADERLMAAAVKLLGSRGATVRDAAARLLFLASTVDTAGPSHRQPAAAALAAQNGAGMARLLGLLPQAGESLQVRRRPCAGGEE
jgi:hypothetical protein